MPTITIDTLTHLLTTHLLHPFIFLLLALTSLATTSSASLFTAISYLHILLPNFPTFCLAISALLALFRLLARLDHALAVGKRRKPNWEEEVVLITGGLGGLGGLIAEVYGMKGVAVAVCDIKDLNKEEEEELEGKGIRYWRCDVGDAGAVEGMMGEVVKELGAPTILIHTAALITPGPLSCTKSTPTPHQITAHFATNTLSHFHLTTHILPHLLHSPTGGHIVTISSILGHTGCAGLSAYCASKAALIAHHRSLTGELDILAQNPAPGTHPAMVKTTLVTPGQLSTPLFSSVTPPSSFLGPVVDVQKLAGEIVRKVDRGEGGEVSMPLYARWIGVLGVLPEGVAGVVRRWSGVDGAGWGAFGGGRGAER